MPIVTQNENGPCPLVALTNVLLLRGSMAIDPGETVVTVQQLSDMLGACLLESIPTVSLTLLKNLSFLSLSLSLFLIGTGPLFSGAGH